MPKLICITGIDGAGKNTLINLLEKELNSTYVSNIWDAMDGCITTIPFKSKKDIDNYLCELSPNSRTLFLAHALKYSVDRAINSGSEYVLLNAYFYKYFATEMQLGTDNELIKNLINYFPLPNHIFLLDISVNEAAKRKDRLSRYECGLVNNPTIFDFIEFQSKVKDKWDNFDYIGWTKLDATKTPKELLDVVLKSIFQ